jgi:hypothetical protein
MGIARALSPTTQSSLAQIQQPDSPTLDVFLSGKDRMNTLDSELDVDPTVMRFLTFASQGSAGVGIEFDAFLQPAKNRTALIAESLTVSDALPKHFPFDRKVLFSVELEPYFSELLKQHTDYGCNPEGH